MSENPFLKEKSFYKRKINPLRTYAEQTGFYLHKMTGKNIDDCVKNVLNSVLAEGTQAKDPIVTFFERDDVTKDKGTNELRLSQYLSSIVKNEYILIPTATAYLNHRQESSLHSEFIQDNVQKRSLAKKAAFKAESEGDIDLFTAKNNEQENKKRSNNSMSGAYASEGSILLNPSAHSTLTSTTRVVSSISNASNEKIIAGNRHYYDPDVTLYNVISITSSIDSEMLTRVIEKYKLIYPSIQDVIDCIKWSSDLYWRDDRRFKRITDFIEKLTPLERAGFVYIGDMYHIRKHNPDVIKELLGTLSRKDRSFTDIDPDETMKTMDEQIVNFAHLICMKEVQGKGKDYSKLTRDEYITLASTCLNIQFTVLQYKDFIEAFFLTYNVPASVAYIPHMVRRTVVLSDTDSTMFSVDEYVEWYFGDIKFNYESYALGGAVMFLATQCIAHSLAIFSANMNVGEDKLFLLSMKPEFTFPVFAQTSVAKHYYTTMLVKEGNVFNEPVIEIKGIHLKNSAAPKDLIKDSHGNMEKIIRSLMNNEKISLLEKLTDLSNKEKKIEESLMNGEVSYFKHDRIKDPVAYSNAPDKSPYQRHTFWMETFQDKYPISDVPPYSVIKIPTILNNISSISKWTESMEDRDLAKRIALWVSKNKKIAIPTLYVSLDYVKAFGIPKEIKDVMDIKRSILDLTLVDRMVLETLGYFPKQKWLINESGY